MRFVVFGAGAVGGVAGARLAQGGYDVVLIGRGAQSEAIRERGIRIESPETTSVSALEKMQGTACCVESSPPV